MRDKTGDVSVGAFLGLCTLPKAASKMYISWEACRRCTARQFCALSLRQIFGEHIVEIYADASLGLFTPLPKAALRNCRRDLSVL